MSEQLFRAYLFLQPNDKEPYMKSTASYRECVEAVDWAEWALDGYGFEGRSRVDIYFNGDKRIHTAVYMLDPNEWNGHAYGILNSVSAKWPVTYEDGGGMDIDEENEPFGRVLDTWTLGDEISPAADDQGMEQKADIESQGESEEFPVEQDEDEDISDEEDDWDDDENDDDEQEEEDGEDEADDPVDPPDAPEPYEDEADEAENGDGDDGDASSDEEEEEGESDFSEDEKDEEDEPVRLKIFAKMRGPKGWRKRAETTAEEGVKSLMSFKIGVLDDTDDDMTPAQQEKDVRVEVKFTDFEGLEGMLTVKLPEGVEFSRVGRTWKAVIEYDDPDEG